MYATGLRISEVAELKTADVYMDEGFLRVFGKGGKERIVPFNEIARDCLKEYLEPSRPALVSGRRARSRSSSITTARCSAARGCGR